MLVINDAIKVHCRHYILHEELDGHRQVDQIVQAQPGERERERERDYQLINVQVIIKRVKMSPIQLHQDAF